MIKNRLVTSSSLLLAVNVVVGLLVFCTGAYLVQKFGEANRGLVAYAISLGPILAAIGGLGSTNAIVFFDGRNEPVSKVFMVRVIKLVGMTLAVIGAFHSLVLYFFSDESPYFVYCMSVIPISAYLTIQIKTWSLARDEVVLYFCVALIQPLVLLLASFIASVENFIVVFSVGLIAECFTVTALYVFFVRNKVPANSQSTERRFIDYSKKNYASNLATVMYARADVIVISFFLDFQNLGLFAIANSIAAQLTLVASSINSLLFGYFMRSDGSKSTAAFLKILVVLLVILLPICVGVGYLGPYILSSIFGYPYSNLSQLLNIVLASTFFYCMSQPFNAKFLSVGQVVYNTKSILISFSGLIVLSALLYGNFGLIGLAYSLLIANITLLFLRSFYFAVSR